MSNSIRPFYASKNTTKTLNEDEAKIKYFFLIDTSDILSQIKASEAYEQYTTSSSFDGINKLFHTIYRCIFSACHEYTKYLNVRGGGVYSFFGNKEPIIPLLSTDSLSTNEKFHYNANLENLLFLSLKYHCILHGFFSSLSDEEEAFYKIAPRYETFLKSSFIKYPLLSPEVPLDSIKNNCNFDSRTISFSRKYTSIKKHPEYYSHKIIITDITRVIPSHRYNYREVPSYFRNWGHFCFDNSSISSIDKYVATPPKRAKTFLNEMSNLHNDIFQILDSYDNNSDRLLFGFPAEWYYCFSTTSYIHELLSTIYEYAQKKRESSAKIHLSQLQITLGTLKGESLLNTIKKVYQLPNVYSRHFFLKYALTAGINSKTLEESYLRPEKPMIEFPSSPPKQAVTANHILSRIDDFIDTLNVLTIPMLETCWRIIIHRLNNEILSPEKQITNKIYQQYLNNNYSLLTADFTILPEDKLLSSFYTFYDDEDAYEYENWLKEYLTNCEQRPFITSSSFSDATKDTVYMLRDYFLSSNQATVSLKPLFNSLDDNMENSQQLKEEAYKFTYKRFRNIYDYFINSKKFI